MSQYIVAAKNIKKIYRMGLVDVHALRGVTVLIKKGEVVSIMRLSIYPTRISEKFIGIL